MKQNVFTIAYFPNHTGEIPTHLILLLDTDRGNTKYPLLFTTTNYLPKIELDPPKVERG